jgi:hypothetical protein
MAAEDRNFYTQSAVSPIGIARAFFNNLKSFTDKYNEVRQFSNLGESQTYLIENFIGSPKLLARLNQE